MGSVVILDPDTDPSRIWTGVESIDEQGARIAFEMLCDLENNEKDEDGVISSTDLACLQEWPRQAQPFRNSVLEALNLATAAGPDAVVGFCALLTDFIALNCSGISADAGRYAELYDL